jgi:hypothetical protein
MANPHGHMAHLVLNWRAKEKALVAIVLALARGPQNWPYHSTRER